MLDGCKRFASQKNGADKKKKKLVKVMIDIWDQGRLRVKISFQI
jgi:hypothetical protein